VLMAHTKLDLRARLMQSALVDAPGLEDELRGYFPTALVERFADALRRHPLRREIIALQLANRLVDEMGMTFLVHAVRDTGRDVIDVVRAWIGVRRLAAGDDIAAQLDAARAHLPAAVDSDCAIALAAAIEGAARWMVETQSPGLDLAALTERWRDAVAALLATWPELATPTRRAAFDADVARLAGLGLDRGLADRLSRLAVLDELFEIADLASAAGVALAVAGDAYFHSAELVDLDWIRRLVPTLLVADDRWEQRAAAGLEAGLRDMRRQITLAMLTRMPDGAPVTSGLNTYAAERREQLDVVLGLIGDLKAAPQPTLPALLVLMHELGRLIRSAAAKHGNLNEVAR
jgi:glutamate dehydrogenase